MSRAGHEAVRPPAPAYPGAAAAAAEKTETTEAEKTETTEENTDKTAAAAETTRLVHFRVVIQDAKQRFGQSKLE